MQTTATADTAADNQHDFNVLSEIIADEPAVISKIDSTDAPPDEAAESATSHTSEESDSSTDMQQPGVEDIKTERSLVVTEAISAAETETGARYSRPALSEVRSQPAGLVYQSSLPERDSVPSGEDENKSVVVSL